MPKNPHIANSASKWRASITWGGAVTTFYAPTRPALYRAVLAWIGEWTGLALDRELQHPDYRDAEDTTLARTAHVAWCKQVIGEALWRTLRRFDRADLRGKSGRRLWTDKIGGLQAEIVRL